MCCITIDTEVLFANFFGSPEYRGNGHEGADIEVIEKCARVLANNLPGYVFYDLTPKAIAEVTRENKDYVMVENKIFYRGESIDRNACNSIYTSGISKRIGQVVDGFFSQGLYDKKVDLLTPIYS